MGFVTFENRALDQHFPHTWVNVISKPVHHSASSKAHFHSMNLVVRLCLRPTCDTLLGPSVYVKTLKLVFHIFSFFYVGIEDLNAVDYRWWLVRRIGAAIIDPI